ncbi:MAG: hypothetical protein BWK79_14145 [Beggiatoa sp. IS2]|nr:MAG: hypothetical protein BWK79_14145 [Beggiatoa sp. IS2]
MKKNLYQLLEISPDATPEQIQMAMVRLGKKYVSNGQIDESTRVHFEQIKEAYQILSSPYRRTAYDVSLEEEEIKKKGNPFRIIRRFFKILWRSFKSLGQHRRPLLNNVYDISTTKWKKLVGEEQSLNFFNGLRNWRIAKSQISTGGILMPAETLIYRAYTHWLLYFDVAGTILVVIPGYFLLVNPYALKENTPKLSLWLVEQPFSVWMVGLSALFFMGLMMLLEVAILKQTTELLVTSKRVIVKSGLFNRKIIELKLRRFESITIDQTLLGRMFDYGSLTITGTGGAKTTLSHIIAPLKFKQTLWQVLESLGE